MDNVMEKLSEVFRDVFDNESIEITKETDIREIDGWDSLVHISLMAAIQDEFGVTYSIDEIAELNTVGAVLTTLGVEK